jgi:hypothetical protein
VEPDKIKRIGRVIFVNNLFRAFKRLCLIIQGYIDRIADFLLPIFFLCETDAAQAYEKDYQTFFH